MELCFLLNESEKKKDYLLNRDLENLKDEGIISKYTTIQEEFLGFPLPEPQNGIVVYRVDNLLIDLAYLKGLWGTIPSNRLTTIINNFCDTAIKFFGSYDISRWTAELDALNEKDKKFCPKYDPGDGKELNNELAEEAYWLIRDFKGYTMARAVIEEGKLEELEQKLDGKYLKKIINI
jgi:hypothetical protein